MRCRNVGVYRAERPGQPATEPVLVTSMDTVIEAPDLTEGMEAWRLPRVKVV